MIDITFAKPRIEPMFEAVIYRSMGDDGNEVYRVLIGEHGTEAKYQGKFVGFHDFTGLTTKDIVEAWVRKKVNDLRDKGNKVEFDQNFRYTMSRVVDSLTREQKQVPANAIYSMVRSFIDERSPVPGLEW